MASKLHTDHEAPLAEINVTPLVDVMLVLLATFIVLATLISTGLPVKLPHAQGQSLSEPTVVTVAVLADGSVRVDDAPIALAALAPLIRQRVSAKPETVIKIGGDGAARYEKVAQVLAAIQQGGGEKITFATQTP